MTSSSPFGNILSLNVQIYLQDFHWLSLQQRMHLGRRPNRHTQVQIIGVARRHFLYKLEVDYLGCSSLVGSCLSHFSSLSVLLTFTLIDTLLWPTVLDVHVIIGSWKKARSAVLAQRHLLIQILVINGQRAVTVVRYMNF